MPPAIFEVVIMLRTTATGFAKCSTHPAGGDPLPGGQISEPPVTWMSSPFCKNILIFRRPKSLLYPPHPVPQEGRHAIVTDAGWDAVDADGIFDERY
jgi:hypothetical protein